MIDQRIRVLRTVSELGTVTAAAHAWGYTPSAVSHQLRALSRDLGFPLLEPDGRNVRLTVAAQILLEGADEMNARWEELRAEIAANVREHGGLLTLCGFSTAAAALLPGAVLAVQESFPFGTVRIVEANPAECFDLLLAERADLAVIVATDSTPRRNDSRFEQQSLLDDPIDLLVPADHPLAQRDSVLLQDASSEDWILDRPGSPYRHLVLAACAYAGFTPSIAHESAEWDTGAALVSAGLGVAIVPRLGRLPEDPRVKRVPLGGDPPPARHILTAIRRGSADQPMLSAALAHLRTRAQMDA
ncbi:LysR family transcriptional regulator [Demetria terragena]|uniref:LysR family transcriptional regulator n=1 Tax=Demetria terragena TaxID=63959 RepID=UPI0003633435|nr:LysR family transcriptional regulator [Demetria terragena]